MSPTSSEKATSHRASYRVSFAIDTEFYHNFFIQDYMTTQYAVCHMERGAFVLFVVRKSKKTIFYLEGQKIIYNFAE